MKTGIHPTNYRPVVFQDLNDSSTFITQSTVATEETITLDGVEYPLVKVHISSNSHPFFTGTEQIVDIEGRVDKFKARRAAGEKARQEAAAKAKAAAAKPKKAKKPSQKPEEKPVVAEATPEVAEEKSAQE